MKEITIIANKNSIINTAKLTQEQLISAINNLSQNDKLIFDISNIENMDSSFIQILISLKKETESKSINLELLLPKEKSFNEYFKNFKLLFPGFYEFLYIMETY